MRFSLFALLLLVSGLGQADANPLEPFFSPADYYQASLAPDGRHFAVSANVDGSANLIILNTQSRKPVAMFTTERYREIDQFAWVNSERVVFSQSISRGWLDYPLYTGELFALNIDNSRKFPVAGWAAGDSSGAFSVLHTMPKEQKKIRVVRRPIKNESIYEARPSAYTLDVYKRPRRQTGTNLNRSPLRDRIISPYPWGSFITDNNGEIRIAWHIDREGLLKISLLDQENEWQPLDEFTPDPKKLLRGLGSPIIGFDPDNTGIYYLAEGRHRTAALIHYNLNSGKRQVLFEHGKFDISRQDAIRASDGEIVGVNLLGTFPEAVFFSDHPEVEALKRVYASFPYQRVRVTNYSENAELALIDVRSDRNPGALYLLNRAKSTITPLLARRSKVDPEQMRTRDPFVIKNELGMSLYGFMTLPEKSSQKPPLLVIPHGGPHGTADTFLFDSEAQFFAQQGYAVLQINFRGSGGYGAELLEAGARQWATGMIDDIEIATRWALQQEFADPRRVCVYGGSYGAFAALSSVIKTPELYQCAAGYAGVYDLTMMYDSDIPFVPAGMAYLKQVLGTDEASLKAQSPAYNADKIQVPIFIAHGGQDERAPISHAESLRDAMDQHGVSYEWMIEPDEGHGFYDTDHRLAYYQRLLNFLNKHTAIESASR